MQKNTLLPFLLILSGLLLSSSALFADIAQPNQVPCYIRVTNLDQFPEYEFYIKYNHSYYYNRGYRPGGTREVILENNKDQSTGQRYSRSKIYARLRTSEVHPDSAMATDSLDTTAVPSQIFETEEYLGGSTTSSLMTHLTEVYEIISLDSGVIHIKKVQSIKGDQKKEKKIKRGQTVTAGPANWYYWVLPSICLAALAGFFLFRMKKRQS